MNLTNLIRKGHLLPVTKPDAHGIPMLIGWKRKPNSRKHGEWTLKKPTVWIDRLAVMQGKALLPGAQIVKEERERQITLWGTQKDDGYTNGDLRAAANCYAKSPEGRSFLQPVVGDGGKAVQLPEGWPWSAEWWKPSKDRIRDLAKAGALYLAESERLRRAGNESESAEVEKLAKGCMGLIDQIYGV